MFAFMHVLKKKERYMKESADDIFNNLIIIRGAGDLATAVAIRLHNSGFRVVCLEVAKPTVIRRTVSFAQAVFEGQSCVENVHARLVSIEDIEKTFSEDAVPVLIDPEADAIRILKPSVLIDAIIAKKNLGTSKDMAPFTIAMGPGFIAGEDVDCVVETARGHNLARLIYSGSAAPNTGIPGNIEGFSSERVIHSPCSGTFHTIREIGDIVSKGEVIAKVGSMPVHATIDGMIRGLLHDGLDIPEHFKIADIDPRGSRADYRTCSDKARALGGAVLEAVMNYLSGRYAKER